MSVRTEDEKEFWKPSEIAKRLRVDQRVIYGMIDRGELHAVKVGRVFRIPATAVRHLLDTDAPNRAVNPAMEAWEYVIELTDGTGSPWKKVFSGEVAYGQDGTQMNSPSLPLHLLQAMQEQVASTNKLVRASTNTLAKEADGSMYRINLVRRGAEKP